MRQRKLKQGGGGEDIAEFDFEGKNKEEEEVKGDLWVCVCELITVEVLYSL